MGKAFLQHSIVPVEAARSRHCQHLPKHFKFMDVGLRAFLFAHRLAVKKPLRSLGKHPPAGELLA